MENRSNKFIREELEKAAHEVDASLRGRLEKSTLRNKINSTSKVLQGQLTRLPPAGGKDIAPASNKRRERGARKSRRGQIPNITPRHVGGGGNAQEKKNFINQKQLNRKVHPNRPPEQSGGQ